MASMLVRTGAFPVGFDRLARFKTYAIVQAATMSTVRAATTQLMTVPVGVLFSSAVLVLLLPFPHVCCESVPTKTLSPPAEEASLSLLQGCSGAFASPGVASRAEFSLALTFNSCKMKGS